MKFRIIASAIVVIILLGLYVVTESGNTSPVSRPSSSQTSDDVFKNLTIN